MKRSGPPKRKTRLRSNNDKLRAWETRTRVKRLADPDHAKVVAHQLVTQHHADDQLKQAREQCRRQANGACEANWEGVCPVGPHGGNHAHHKILRSQGGPDEAWNLMWVCHQVHHHAHNVDRAGAEQRGIIIRGGYTPPRGRALGDDDGKWPGGLGRD